MHKIQGFYHKSRSSRPELFSGKGVLKIYRKFTGERPCRSVISIKFQAASGRLLLLKAVRWFPLSGIIHNFRSSHPEVLYNNSNYKNLGHFLGKYPGWN